MPLDLSWVRDARVNRSAVERRAATIPTRRSIKTAWQAGWLLRAITLMDLTTLQGDDTPGRVRRLCAKARQPVRADLLESLGMQDVGMRVAAVCVYHAFVKTAVEALEGSGIPVAAVSTGFPAGLSPFKTRLAEIEASVADGAEEIDIVITRAHVLTGNWQALYDEVRAFRDACGAAHLKTILGTGELATLKDVSARLAGRDDGRRRLHQDQHRQGKRQCGPAGGHRDGARDSRVPRAHRASASASSRRAAFARPRNRSTGSR